MSDQPRTGFDPNVPNIARIYDYMLGGKDNFAADRTAADLIIAAFPEVQAALRLNRSALGRVVEYLTGEVGIRQFLDIGSGLPTQRNVDEIARAVSPDARVVYVDNDPVVRVHGEALLASAPGAIMVEADLRDPKAILKRAHEHLDFDRPVALLLIAILHFIPDEDDPLSHVAQLLDALAPGSFLVISHMLDSPERQDDVAQVRNVYEAAGSGIFPRTLGELLRFFDGLELLDPTQFASPEELDEFGQAGWAGVARKP